MSLNAHQVIRRTHSTRGLDRCDHRRALLLVALSAALAAPLGAQDRTPTPAAQAAGQTATEEPEWFKGAVRPGPGITNPVLLKSAKPSYSKEAMEAKVTGAVWLDARVDVDGRVRNVRVVRSIPLLDAEAEKAAKEFEFRPAMKDGEQVAAIVRIEIVFNLRSTPN